MAFDVKSDLQHLYNASRGVIDRQRLFSVNIPDAVALSTVELTKTWVFTKTNTIILFSFR